jgi:hypothetical protein
MPNLSHKIEFANQQIPLQLMTNVELVHLFAVIKKHKNIGYSSSHIHSFYNLPTSFSHYPPQPSPSPNTSIIRWSLQKCSCAQVHPFISSFTFLLIHSANADRILEIPKHLNCSLIGHQFFSSSK